MFIEFGTVYLASSIEKTAKRQFRSDIWKMGIPDIFLPRGSMME